MRTVDCAYADGTGAGDAPLTWAQRFMWKVVAAAGAGQLPFDLLLRHEFPKPIPVEAAVELLRGFVLRHPVLRTTIEVTSAGTPIQHVSATGVLRVSLCEIAASADPDQIRDLIPGTTLAQMCQPSFLVAGELVAGLALRISHLIADGYGVHLLTADVAATTDGASASPSPIALAQFEGSTDGAAVNRRALAFAEGVYTSCPPTMWPAHRCASKQPRFVYGQLRSAALLESMDALTQSRGLGPAGVLIGALAAVTASSAGLESALLFTVSSNRFDSAWRAYPGQLSQEAILHVPLAPTLTGTMRTAAMETMRSLRVARYDPAQLEALRQRVEWERGVCFDQLGSAIVLNLVTDGPTPAVEGRRAEPRGTSFAWTGSTNQENLGFYLDAFPTAAEFVLSARVDTTLLSPDEAKAWLYAIEWAIVASAAGDVPTADLRARFGAAPDTEQIRLISGEQLVARVTGAALVRAMSTCDGATGGPAYLCYVVDPRHATTPEEMHAAVMAELPSSQPAVAPSEYIIVGAPPADLVDSAAWPRLPVLARGSGR